MNRIHWYGPTIVVLATVLLVMISGPRLVQSLVYAQEQVHIRLASDHLKSKSGLLLELNDAFRSVADAVRPSVVSIHTYSRPKARLSRRSPSDLQEFLERHLPFGGDEWDAEAAKPKAQDDEVPYEVLPVRFTGSGWVFDEDGHIVTNYHVIKDAQRIEVHFANGDERAAKVVGSDPETDVAVLKVEGGRVHAVRLADQPVKQGDMVFAFGSPLRFEFSMSQGIVSATERELNIITGNSRSGRIHGYENFIQTDAAINQGNSGGPLTDVFGRVVGMNTAIATTGTPFGNRFGEGGFVGLGFAIPVDMVHDVVDKIIRHGRVERGWLGIGFRPLSSKETETFGYDGGAAVVVETLRDDGPAGDAGLRRGDRITRIDDTKIRNGPHLRRLIGHLEPGTKIDIEVFRDDRLERVPVTLGEKPASLTLGGRTRDRTQPDQIQPDENEELLSNLGLEAVTMTRDLADENVSFQEGVLVRRVRRNSIAAEAGLRPGLLITHVKGKPVSDRTEFVEALRQSEHGLLRISVVDNEGGAAYLFFKMPQ